MKKIDIILKEVQGATESKRCFEGKWSINVFKGEVTAFTTPYGAVPMNFGISQTNEGNFIKAEGLNFSVKEPIEDLNPESVYNAFKGIMSQLNESNENLDSAKDFISFVREDLFS